MGCLAARQSNQRVEVEGPVRAGLDTRPAQQLPMVAAGMRLVKIQQEVVVGTGDI